MTALSSRLAVRAAARAAGVCVALAAGAAAQPLAHNKLELANWWLTDREDLFPNYATPAGNAAGDGLFKVIPGEVMERGEAHRATGYQVIVSIDDAYTFTAPVTVNMPAIAVHETQVMTIGGRTYETLDPVRPVGLRFDPLRLTFESDNSWVVEVRLLEVGQVRALPPRTGTQRGGFAVMALAEPGVRRGPTTPGVVLQSSFGERHFEPGRDSYSGSFDARAGALRMFGTAGMPSATGELALALRFDDATLQLAGPSAGGVVNDPTGFETQLGVGAYATDLASGPRGHVRLFVQDARHDGRGGRPQGWAFPLVVAAGAAGPAATLPFGPAPLRIDPASFGLATLLLEQGAFGALTLLRGASGGGFDADQPGVWNSAPIAVPSGSITLGLDLWIQAVILADQTLAPLAASNAVRLALR
jgi:hypothetical protein